MKIKIKIYGMILCCFLCMLMTGCNSKKDKTPKTEDVKEATRVVLTTGFRDDEVFRIGKASCTLDEAKVYLINTQNQYESVYGSEIWKRNVNDVTLEDKVKDTVIARVAQVKTMNLLASQYEMQLAEEEEQKVLHVAGLYFDSLTEEEKKTMNASKELIEQLYREYALANKVYAEVIRGVNPEISDDEARIITVKQILIKTYAVNAEGENVPYTEDAKKKALTEAEEICEKAQKGEDFDSLILKHSEDVNSTYYVGKGEAETLLEETVFNLSTDQISDVIETETGYRILKCINTFDRKETDANKEKIVEQRKKEAFEQVYDEFVKSLPRNLNKPLWDTVRLEFDDTIKTSSFFQVYNENFE